MLPWALFGAHRTCCYCINQVTVLQGQFGILGNMPFYPSTMVATPFIHPNPLYLLKDQLLGLIPELEHQLLYCQGVSMPYEPGCRKQWGLPLGQTQMSFHTSWPTGAHSWITCACFPLARAGTTIRGALSPSFLCHGAWPIPSGVIGISNSKGSSAWDIPRALIGFTGIFTFSQVACCSDPWSHMCPFFNTVLGREEKSYKSIKSLWKLSSLSP